MIINIECDFGIFGWWCSCLEKGRGFIIILIVVLFKVI